MIQSIQSVSSQQFVGTILLFVVEGNFMVSMDRKEYHYLQESDILIINI